MDSTTLFSRRVARLLADEQYGPALARLNQRDTELVLSQVRDGNLRRARTEITRLDRERRTRETAARDRRRRSRVIAHIQVELESEGVRYNMGTVSFGVSLMTRDQIIETLDMRGDEIRDHAGDYTKIRQYEHLSLAHNVWWYH